MKYVSRGSLRPTASKVVEALFAILGDKVSGSRFLDLYAGVGSVGLEAWRCGASHVVFVEKSASTMKVLRDNLRAEGANGRALLRDAVVALRGLDGEAFDLVFVDPPYGSGEVSRCLIALAAGGLVVPGGQVIAEHHHKDAIPESVGTLVRYRSQKYGETVLSFYRQDALPAS